MKQFLEIVLPLLLPTAIYFAYVLLLRPRSGAGNMPEVPWTWLAVAGGILLAVTFLAISLIGGAPPSARYLPPRSVDGKIEPGHYEPAP